MKKKINMAFLILLCSTSILGFNSFTVISNNINNRYYPALNINIPINVYLAGFELDYNGESNLLRCLPLNSSYTYIYGEEERTRFFYYGNSKLNILLKNNYKLHEIPIDKWTSVQETLLNLTKSSTLTVPVGNEVKTLNGFYLPVIITANMFRNWIDTNPGAYNIILIKPTISPLNNTLHWYKGERYRSSIIANYYDMRIGWSVDNNSVFIDVSSYSWWVEQNHPDELKIMSQANQNNITAIGKIISRLVYYLIDNVPLLKIPIIPIDREMRLSLITIYNTSIKGGSPYYLVDMDSLVKKTNELFPYFNTIPKYYGTYKLSYMYAIKDLFEKSIITYNNITFLNFNPELKNVLYVFAREYLIPKNEKNYFNIFVFFFDLDVPIYELVDDQLIEPTGYSSGIIFIDNYKVTHDTQYSDYELRYSALSQIPPIFGVMPHSKYSSFVDFVQDPLSNYDMDKEQYISYSNFTKYAFARYYSVLYNVSILYGLKDSNNYLQKYPFIHINLDIIEEGLNQANTLFRNGYLLKAAVKYFDTWDEYLVLREKLSNWIVSIESSYFWGSIILSLFSGVIFLREKKVEEIIEKEIRRLIDKGKKNKK